MEDSLEDVQGSEDFEAISGRDLKDFCDMYGINYVNYEDLRYPIRGYNIIFLEFARTPNDRGGWNIVGHWMLIYRNEEGKLVFFDSYGSDPNDITSGALSSYSNDPEILRRAIGGEPVDWNRHPLQEEDLSIATCGWWCIARLLNDHLSSEEFYDEIKDIDDKDLWVGKYVARMFN